ncbi:MAG: zf-HC2 domain-containing protein [Deltaproteobacteria bacterium]|nr:zf-HC2 domain-containing protein [Deltaproteobacteria bacterium]
MTHPDDSTLQQWVDQALEPAEARDVAAHAATCARCARRGDAVRALGRATRRWADEAPATDLDLLGAILAATTGPNATAVVPPPEPVPTARRSTPLRRFLYPALAAAAAALFALRTPPQDNHPNTRPPVVTPAHTPPQNPTTPVEPLEGPGGAEVTRVDVQGAKSYAVLVIPGMRESSTSAVVWIQDEPEDPTSPDPQATVTVQ